MGDYIDIVCKNCGEKVQEFWIEELIKSIVIKIAECGDCGWERGTDELLSKSPTDSKRR